MNLLKAKELCEELMGIYGLGKVWRFKWIRAWNTYGRCSKITRTIQLSKHFVEVNDESEVRNTILHEIAHAKCHKSGHNKFWKAWCIKLGARPIRINTLAVCPDKFNKEPNREAQELYPVNNIEDWKKIRGIK